ncbi:MAG: DUF1638 domain-containing protein [Firmicutes bacterium]|nr:DUF1638 domain-containing protein [Bacillota bacterium]
MPVTGIITCRILELEFGEILGNDDFYDTITVIEDKNSVTLAETAERRNKPKVRRIPHLRAKLPVIGEEQEALVKVLEIGLHRNQKILRDTLQKAAEEISLYADVLVLGYGTCGNALTHPPDVEIPVFVPMDEGLPVDDCVCLELGGRKEYSAQQHLVPGTYYMTAGWCRHWKEMFDCPEAIDRKTLERIFRGYGRALLVKTPVMTESEMTENIKEFRDIPGIRTEFKCGSLEMLGQVLEKSREYLRNSGKK